MLAMRLGTGRSYLNLSVFYHAGVTNSNIKAGSRIVNFINDLILGSLMPVSSSNIVVQYKDRTVVGLNERVTVYGPKGKKKEVMARIDTGATKSSVDVKLAADLELGPILKSKVVKSASGNTLRPVIHAEIEIADKRIGSEFTMADRSHMKYSVLIGQNILKDNKFLVDPTKQE